MFCDNVADSFKETYFMDLAWLSATMSRTGPRGHGYFALI
jgi:hypothetical protein